MNKKLLLSLFLVLLFALKAEASDWVRIDLETKEENTDKIFIELANLKDLRKVFLELLSEIQNPKSDEKK